MKNINNMKKTIIILLTMLVVLPSCDDFLDEEMVTEQTYAYYETEEGAEAVVNSCYQTLRIRAAGEWSYGIFNFGTDEFMKGEESYASMYGYDEYNDYDAELDGHDKTGAETDIGDWWDVIYNGINRCNTAIDKIALVTDGTGKLKDQAGKDERTAEVRFIRAYHYFQLVQQFGAIPVSLEPSSAAKYEWPRISAKEVYEIILDDLKWAYDNITHDVAETQNEYGRITKDAVRHYWAKVLLTRACGNKLYNAATDADEARNYDVGGNYTEDLTKAATLIDEVITGGRHSLVPDFANLFAQGNEVNSEIILPIKYNDVAGLNESVSTSASYVNRLHLYWFFRYDNKDNLEPGMARNVDYDIPFRRMMPTDYSIDVFDRLNDSRLRKSFLEVFKATETVTSAYPTWTKAELGFAFGLGDPANIAPDSSWAIRYGDTIRVGEIKFDVATAITGSEHVNMGDTALVFLINDSTTTLTDRQMVAAGYTYHARYFWITDAAGNPVTLQTWDRNDANVYFSSNVSSVSGLESYSWGREKAAGLSKNDINEVFNKINDCR